MSIFVETSASRRENCAFVEVNCFLMEPEDNLYAATQYLAWCYLVVFGVQKDQFKEPWTHVKLVMFPVVNKCRIMATLLCHVTIKLIAIQSSILVKE